VRALAAGDDLPAHRLRGCIIDVLQHRFVQLRAKALDQVTELLPHSVELFGKLWFVERQSLACFFKTLMRITELVKGLVHLPPKSASLALASLHLCSEARRLTIRS